MKEESTGRILPRFLSLVSLCLILILMEKFGLIKPVRGVVEKISVPVKTSVYRVWQGMAGAFSDLTSAKACRLKITELESQVRELSSLKAKLQVLEEENRALRKQLEAPLPPSFKFLPAKTLAQTRYLTIDRGEQDGVKPQMLVVSENILVGKVLSVTPTTAQILLPTDPDSKIPARTLKTSAQGLVVGEFGTKVIFDKVLQGESLEEGDLIVTTGEGEYARDLLIGKLGKIEKVPVQPFQKGRITPLLNYGKLVNVFVVIK